MVIKQGKLTHWYADYSHFVHLLALWFGRGGDYNYGLESGIFAFGDGNGAMSLFIGFRVILIP